MFAPSVQIISGLDSQSKFQMFILLSGCHVGVPGRNTNMVPSYWALQICAKYFDKYLKFGRRIDLNLGEVSYLVFKLFLNSVTV